MKNQIVEKINANKNKASMILVFMLLLLMTLGCSQLEKLRSGQTDPEPKSTRTVDDDTDKDQDKDNAKSEYDDLVKGTLDDFKDALEEQDFSDFLEKTSKPFKSTYSNSKMKSTFKGFLDKRKIIIPLMETIRDKTPDYATEPEVRTEKGVDDVLVTKGSFDTSPNELFFENKYIQEDGEWKLITIQIEFK